MGRDTLRQILDLARWAPSGDNTQPWRFEILSESKLAVHGYDTRSHVLYDFDGRPSQMAHGALLETLRLAATRFGLQADWRIRAGQSETAPIYDVDLSPSVVLPDPLAAFIEQRCVQRRAMRTTALTTAQKAALDAAVGKNYRLIYFEPLPQRLSVARLLWASAYLRLTCPEAYAVHRDIIEWGAQCSDDRIPEQAVGVDPVTARLMRWVMRSWPRVAFFNHYLGGTILPRIQLDLLPAIACAAHIMMHPTRPSLTLADHLAAGVALQRLWLTATQSGLFLQPEMTPLIFRWYVGAGRPISAQAEINAGAARLARLFDKLAGARAGQDFSFLCRVGASSQPASRSLRKPLSDLTIP